MIRLIHADCLQAMQALPDQSIDLILCDLPYGTTACKWDSVIPFAPLWEQYKRLIKPNCAIVLTASQPFTSLLISSNLEMYKYNWVWDKARISNPQLAKYQPLKQHEDIVVFSKNTGRYYPQGLIKLNKTKQRKAKQSKTELLRHINRRADYEQQYTNYPKTIIQHKTECGLHPTQKPVALMEYLIKTYTLAGDTVLDNCMGSGTTGVACINTGRKFIGIEQDAAYFQIAQDRIGNTQ